MIRLAGPEDQSAVEACVADAYEKYRPMINRTPGPMLDDYAALIAQGYVDVYERPSASGQMEIVGVMVAFGEPRDDPEHYEIETLAVLEKAQGEGVGRAFLSLAEQRIVARDIQWARLYTNEVMVDNYAWYRRWGYVDYERRNDRGYNRIFFEKQIAPIAVRPMRRGEGARLKEIRQRALLDSPSAFSSTYEESQSRSLDDWESYIAGVDDESRRYVAVVEDRWVGLVGTFRSAHGIELISMWTAPSVRGRGVGRLLVEAVLRRTGSEQVGLWVMNGNDAARSLYERCGFVADVGFDPSPTDPCRDELRMVRRPPTSAQSGAPGDATSHG